MIPIAGQIKIETENGIDVFELTFKKHIPYSKLQSQNAQKYKALSDENTALSEANAKLIKEAKIQEKARSKRNLERTFFIVVLGLLATFIAVLILTR